MRILFAIIFVLFITTSSYSENLFVMGWDGAGKINVDRLLQEGKLPNLQAFINDGACYMPLESIGATYTMPNWTMLFTGLTYDQSGVAGNMHYTKGTILDPAYSMDNYLSPASMLWFHQIPFQYTFFNPIKNKGQKVGIFISKDSKNNPWIKIYAGADTTVIKNAPVIGDDYIDELGNAVLSFISSTSDFILFFHTNPDTYGHKHGENSARYEQEFIRSDYWLGRVMSIIDKNNTKLIVMTDHGFDEDSFTHANASDLWWATDLPVKNIYCQGEAIGTVRDLANTILSYYGVDWKSRTPKLRGKSLLNQ